MAFFDNLSKKVSEAGQKTIQKTKELADTSRLNMMIADEEKSITNTYYQIGKLYTSIHKEDCEEDFAGMIAMVAESEAKIREYKKQIQDIKGVQRCEACGAEVPNGAAFCSSCGASMPKVQVSIPDDVIKCESCGADVKKGMRFCTACGKPMTATTVASTTENVTDSEPEKVCQNCGAKLDHALAFCTECGTKL